MKVLATALACFAALAVCQGAAFAQQATPLGKHGAPVHKTLVVETVSKYTVFEYSPPLEMTEAKPDFQHPEAAARSLFSAVRAKDYDAYLKCWDARSQAVMAERDRKIGFTPDKWRAMWEGTFRGKRIQLTHWIGYGKYVLLNYRVEPAASAETAQAVLVLAQENGAWKATQDLREDQILTAWNGSTGRIQVMSDANARAASGAGR